MTYSSSLSHTFVKSSGIPVPARSSSFASLFSKLQINDNSANRVLSNSTRSRLPIPIKSADKTSPVFPRMPTSLPANVTPLTAAAITARIEQRRRRVIADLAAAKRSKQPRVTRTPGPSILKSSSKPGRVVPFPPHVRPSSPEQSRQVVCTRKYIDTVTTNMTVAEEATYPPSKIPFLSVSIWFGDATVTVVPCQLKRGYEPFHCAHERRQWATTPAEADVDPDRRTKVRFAERLISSVLEYEKWYKDTWMAWEDPTKKEPATEAADQDTSTNPVDSAIPVASTRTADLGETW